MNHRLLSRRALALATCALTTFASCSSNSRRSDDSLATPSCAEVCVRFDSLCGSRPPGCEEQCEAAAGPDDRRCVTSAPSCEVAAACGRTPSDGGPAETDGGSGETDAGGGGHVDCTPDSEYSFYGFVGTDTETCAPPCRTYGGLDGTGYWCTASCETDADCDPEGAGRYVCHRLQSYCTWPCGDEAACAGFRTCDVINGYCVM